jgi:hypothetical protein
MVLVLHRPRSVSVGNRIQFAIGCAKSIAASDAEVETRNFNGIEIANAEVKALGVNWARIGDYPRHLRDNPFARALNPHHGVGSMELDGNPPRCQSTPSRRLGPLD